MPLIICNRATKTANARTCHHLGHFFLMELKFYNYKLINNEK